METEKTKVVYRCDNCDDVLTVAHTSERDGVKYIRFDPCGTCISTSFDDGYDEGYSEGGGE